MLSTLALAILLAQSRASRPALPESATTATASEHANDGEKDKDDRKDRKKKEEKEEPPVVTKHTLSVRGTTLAYTATTGFLPLKTDAGDVEAKVFFMAYTLDRGTAPASKRPLTFSFNGGPGAASVWLHMGALGPKRVKMKDADGMMPAPPYGVVDNEETWLSDTDLVFIDPVGTGYSRASKPELGKKFWGLDGDIASVGEFIRLYLTRYERWGSPLFLVGESYGTTRAAGLSGYLVDRGIAFNGIVLVSSILNFQTGRFTARQRPSLLALPADVRGDGLVPQEAAGRPAGEAVRAVLDEVEAFAGGEYPVALAKGDTLTPAERKALAARLARYTGLDAEWIDARGRADRDPALLPRAPRARAEERRPDRLALHGRQRIGHRRAARLRPEHRRDRPAVHGRLQPVREGRPRVQERPHVLRPRAAGSGARGNSPEHVRRHERRAPVRVREEPLDAALRRLRALRPRDTPLRDALHARPHGTHGRAAYAHHGREYEAGHMMYLQTGELAKLRKDVGAFFASALGK